MSTELKQPAEATSVPPGKNKKFILILTVLVVAGGWFGISKYIHSLHHEETEDAQIEAKISPVIPRISGYVAEVRVKDNQAVKKGDTLIVLDDRDMQMKLAQAEAALQTAKSSLSSARASSGAAFANIATSKASVATATAQIEAAKVNVWRTSQDLERYENLIRDHSITQQQYEQVLAAKQTAERQLQVLEEQKNQVARQSSAVASQSNATSSQVGIADATIHQREVDVQDARLLLSYTVITAPEDGVVSKVNVQDGQFLQAGTGLFSIVLSNNLWVVGNFKETQYEHIKEGQRVMVTVDAFPEHEFEAKVSSFSPATGAKFALLPPDNASGNFVKVVQRLPVKIEFTNPSDAMLSRLRAGLNVTVDVHLD